MSSVLKLASSLIPHEPFTVKIREILVRTQRSLRNEFGAARQTMPFGRVNDDKMVCGLQLFLSSSLRVGKWCRPALGSLETSAQIHRYAGRV